VLDRIATGVMSVDGAGRIRTSIRLPRTCWRLTPRSSGTSAGAALSEPDLKPIVEVIAEALGSRSEMYTRTS
jgi:hypothetical protein